jgi:hypothetical protein
MTAHSTVTAAPTTVSTAPVAFELDDSQLSAIRPNAGRKATPSIYLAEVTSAIGTDKAFGIAVPADVKASYIVSELHKAAATLGVKIKVWNRAAITETNPFVGFKIKPDVLEPVK